MIGIADCRLALTIGATVERRLHPRTRAMERADQSSVVNAIINHQSSINSPIANPNLQSPIGNP
jgi:hypothetical protein